jgi:hypothetical protein
MSKHSYFTLAMVLVLIIVFGKTYSTASEKKVIPSIPWLLLDDEKPSMLIPYVDQDEISGIYEAYSEDVNCPWGFVHNGIDFFPYDDPHTIYTPFQAVVSGTIETVEIHENHYDNKIFYQVNVSLRYDEAYLIWYAFEPFTNDAADGTIQREAIVVEPGQKVTAGEVIGRLYNPSADVGAHVHFGVTINHEWVCPEPYFTSEARVSVLELLHLAHPGAEICYFADD